MAKSIKLLPTIKKATIDEIIPTEVEIYDLSSTSWEITTIQKNSVIIKSIPFKSKLIKLYKIPPIVQPNIQVEYAKEFIQSIIFVLSSFSGNLEPIYKE